MNAPPLTRKRPVVQERPTRFDASFRFRLPADVLASVDAIADRRGQSRARVIRDALEVYLRLHEGGQP